MLTILGSRSCAAESCHNAIGAEHSSQSIASHVLGASQTTHLGSFSLSFEKNAIHYPSFNSADGTDLPVGVVPSACLAPIPSLHLFISNG
jgi:hypothetical protein